jgi:hypothetical protein
MNYRVMVRSWSVLQYFPADAEEVTRRQITQLQGRNSNSSSEEEPYGLTARSGSCLTFLGTEAVIGGGEICRLVMF